MQHQDHVNLIRKTIPKVVGIWVDLGSGKGAFTLALAELLLSGSKIYSIDKNGLSLKAQEAEFNQKFPFFTTEFLQLDFTNDLPFKEKGLDGILMANSLHFIQNKVPLLKNLRKLLKPRGRIVFVEYNVDEGNTWVPYPFSFESLKDLGQESGFQEPKLAGTVPSQFLNEMYCAYFLADS